MLVRALIFSTLISLGFNLMSQQLESALFGLNRSKIASLIVLISEQEQTEAVFPGAAPSQCQDNIVGRHCQLSPCQEPCCWRGL